MSRKTLGRVELQWTCPNCGGINPGPVTTCENCGAAQPKDVQFEQASRPELIAEESEPAKAAGPDIHCPYCGTRNPSGAKICSQCGGDISEGVRRETGKVVGAFQTGPALMVNCPRCGAANPDTAKTCSQCGSALAPEPLPVPAPAAPVPSARPKPPVWVYAVLGALLLCVCGAIGYYAFLAGRTEAATGVVQGTRWARSIPIEALVEVERRDWRDQVPAGAQLGSCQEEVRSVQDEPGPNTLEVCGTPYTVDTGDGFGDVVQDCEYQVMDQYCTYSIEEWQVVDNASASGEGFDAFWPNPVAGNGRRMGSGGSETYTIVFAVGDQTYTYQTEDFELFQQAQVGSEWQLNINSFGSILSIER